MRNTSSDHRVVITGMGGVTPIGNNVDDFWQSCLEAKSGIDWITLCDASAYRVQVDGEVRGFDPQEYMDRKEARRMARFAQFAVAATRMALDDAELRTEDEDAYQVGVMLGSGIGGFPDTDEAVAHHRPPWRKSSRSLLYVKDAAEYGSCPGGDAISTKGL